MSYTVPDRMLDDIDADNRDARDLELEAKRQAAWDDLLSSDGDISEVLERLVEHPHEALSLMIAFDKDQPLDGPAHRLADRLTGIAYQVIEETLEHES